MYYLYKKNPVAFTKISYFAERLIGLLIVYTKFFEDCCVFNQDFIDARLFDHVAIYEVLKTIPLNKIEQTVLKQLDYKLMINFNHLLCIFDTLPDRAILSVVYSKCCHLIGHDALLDTFIRKVSKYQLPKVCLIGHGKIAISRANIFQFAAETNYPEEELFVELISELEPKLEILANLREQQSTLDKAYNAGLELEKQLYQLFFSYQTNRGIESYQQFNKCIHHVCDELVMIIIGDANPVPTEDWKRFILSIKNIVDKIGHHYNCHTPRQDTYVTSQLPYVTHGFFQTLAHQKVTDTINVVLPLNFNR